MTKKSNNRRRKFFANVMHRELFFLVFLASLVPTLLTAVAVYYVIFFITAEQIGIPESIALTLFPAAQRVINVLTISLPIAVVVLLVFAYKVTHRAVGPMDRIISELDACVKGTKKDHISLRKNDRFWPLVNKINKLIDAKK